MPPLVLFLIEAQAQWKRQSQMRYIKPVAVRGDEGREKKKERKKEKKKRKRTEYEALEGYIMLLPLINWDEPLRHRIPRSHEFP